MTNFGVFERRPAGRARPGMTVTVMRRGYLAFSEGAWAALGSPQAVQFLTDTGGRARAVGFRACEPGEPGTNLVRGNRVVTAMAVLRHLGHDLGGAGRCYPLHLKDGLPPYIDLDDLSEDAPAPGSWQEAAAALREDIDKQVLPVVLDLAVLARHGALAGVAEIIAERRAQAELGDGHGDGWLRGSLDAWLTAGDWGRQDLREAGALIAAEIDREAAG